MHQHHGGGACCDHHHDSNNNAQLTPTTKDIFFAASIGDVGLLKQLIEVEHVDVNSRQGDSNGVTALHWAALKNNLEALKFLCDNGAELDAPNVNEGHTPLMWACIEGHLKIVHYLLEQGADAHKVDLRGYNALHHAVQYNQTIDAHFLITKGLYVDCKDNEGHTPLMWAAYMDHDDAIRYLLSQGSDVNVADNGGLTALHWAALKGKTKAAKALLDDGHANSCIRDKEGESPSAMALRKGFVKLAKMLKQRETSTVPRWSEKQLSVLWFCVSFIGFFVHIHFTESVSFVSGRIIYCSGFYLCCQIFAGQFMVGCKPPKSFVGRSDCKQLQPFRICIFDCYHSIYWLIRCRNCPLLAAECRICAFVHKISPIRSWLHRHKSK